MPAADEQGEKGAKGLTRQLGLASATAAAVGEMIAVGIFLTPAGMAKTLGSPLWILVVWLLMGAMALAGALCYGELAARFPEAGGGYVYLRGEYGAGAIFQAFALETVTNWPVIVVAISIAGALPLASERFSLAADGPRGVRPAQALEGRDAGHRLRSARLHRPARGPGAAAQDPSLDLPWSARTGGGMARLDRADTAVRPAERSIPVPPRQAAARTDPDPAQCASYSPIAWTTCRRLFIRVA